MQSVTRAVLTAGVGAVLTLSATASAGAEVSGLDVESGTLQSRGLVANVPVTFACDEGAQYDLSLSVMQVVQQKTVTGGGTYTFGTCTGETQTVSMQVRPGPKPFKKGPALADASISTYCDDPEFGYVFCGSASVESDEMRLR